MKIEVYGLYTLSTVMAIITGGHEAKFHQTTEVSGKWWYELDELVDRKHAECLSKTLRAEGLYTIIEIPDGLRII